MVGGLLSKAHASSGENQWKPQRFTPPASPAFSASPASTSTSALTIAGVLLLPLRLLCILLLSITSLLVCVGSSGPSSLAAAATASLLTLSAPSPLCVRNSGPSCSSRRAVRRAPRIEVHGCSRGEEMGGIEEEEEEEEEASWCSSKLQTCAH